MKNKNFTAEIAENAERKKIEGKDKHTGQTHKTPSGGFRPSQFAFWNFKGIVSSAFSGRSAVNRFYAEIKKH